MTDKEILREIEQQEKRLAKSGSGKMLAKSARDYLKLLFDAEKKFSAVAAKYTTAKTSLAKLDAAVKKAEENARKQLDDAKRMRSQMSKLRLVVNSGDRLKRKENVARARLADKIKCLKAMSAE